MVQMALTTALRLHRASMAPVTMDVSIEGLLEASMVRLDVALVEAASAALGQDLRSALAGQPVLSQ